MRKIIYLFAAVLLCGCAGGTESVPVINAEGLEGIGKVHIGDSFDNVVSVLSKAEERHSFVSYPTVESGVSLDEITDLRELNGDYKLTPTKSINMSMTFYRDSLVYIIVLEKRVVREAIIAKYGEGESSKSKSVESNKWVGEVATANYLRNDYLGVESLEFTPTYGNKAKEIKEEIQRVKEAKESKRIQELKDGI